MPLEACTVLLVEDNERLNEINRRALQKSGFAVLCAHNLAGARAHLAQSKPDVILLDVALPDGDGIAFCGEIRAVTDAHILFLTSKTEHQDKIRGLDTGGDDYITKPYKLEELLSRVRAAVRRRGIEAAKAPPRCLAYGPLTLDTVARQAHLDGRDLLLTPKDFALLLTLAQNHGRALTAQQLYAQVWNAPMAGDDHAVKNGIYRLRKKLQSHGGAPGIRFTRGAGYRLD